MKAFELMSELSEMPSGADVEFRTLMPRRTDKRRC